MAAARTAPAPLVYSKTEAAEALRISVRTLNRIIADDLLIVQYIGHKPVITAVELQAYVDRLPYALPGDADEVTS